MTNSDLWEQYGDYTKELSSIARQLGFAAAAISWFFKTTENLFPSMILTALMFIVGFFLADLLQYLLAAMFLRFWIRHQEKQKWNEQETLEGEYSKPVWLDYPAFFMWLVKIGCLFIAYILIGVHVLQI